MRMLGDEPPQERVERARGYACLPAVESGVERARQSVDVPARTRGDVDARRPLHADQFAVDLLVEVVAPFAVDEVPLVEGDDERTTRLGHRGDDAGVLLGDRLARIDQYDRDLGTVDRGVRTQARVVLVPGGLLDPAPDTRGVDQLPGLPGELDQLVNGVDGRAGDVDDDRAYRASELVEQARLSVVRLADERDPAGAVGSVELLRRWFGERVENDVEQVAAPPTVQRRHHLWLAEAEVPQRGGLGLGALIVHLVRGEHNGPTRAPQDPYDRLVGVGDADGRVDDEQHGVRGLDGDLGLLGDLLGEPACVRVPTTGVDDGERPAVPHRVVRDAVAGHTRSVLDDGLTAPEHAVHQRRLADVRPADDGEHGRCRGQRSSWGL